MPEFPRPTEGIVLTHFIVTSDVDRSRRFYAGVLGGEVLLDGRPTIEALAPVSASDHGTSTIAGRDARPDRLSPRPVGTSPRSNQSSWHRWRAASRHPMGHR